jgi:hypothetical protein
MGKSKLLIIFLVIWIVISNGLILFFWKATNLGDIVMWRRIEPLTCKFEEYKYKVPYSKIEGRNISESDWQIYQKVGTELVKDLECPEYTDYVWFNLIEENINNTINNSINE